MALVDPYAPCPCGSLQKYKWCCHKSETAAIRVERLIQTDQLDQAAKAVEEGLAKEPKSFWLLSQKSFIQERRKDFRGAKATVDRITELQTDHQGAWANRVALALQADGPAAAVDELQLALAACPNGGDQFVSAVLMVGVTLARTGDYLAALAHLELGGANSPENSDSLARSAYTGILGDPSISPWLKNPYDLSPAPEGIRPDQTARFDEALADAESGLWSRAAARFDALAAEGVPGADLDQAFCRLWIMDDAGGTAALRRHLAKLGNSTDAVDLEALAQNLAPIGENDQVDRVRMSWPIRNRDALLEILRKASDDRRAVGEGEEPLDASKPDSPDADVFAILDRPVPESSPDLRATDLPRVKYRVLVTKDNAYLEAIDDGKLDYLRDDFLALAAQSVPPAHPKIRTVDRVSRQQLALRTEWVLPRGLDRPTTRRIEKEEQDRVLLRVWPDTPMTFLGGRTPRQAAQAGDAEVPLRAALFQQEESSLSRRPDSGPVAALREELRVPPEPTPDPQAVDLDDLHLARLILVPADRLTDDQLEHLHARARTVGLLGVIENVCRVLIDRPEALAKLPAPQRYVVFSDLASSTLARGDDEGALAIISRGRAEEPAAHKAENAPRWDFLELRLRLRNEKPESWVPELAAILDRYRESDQASPTILSNLMELRLIQMAPHPDRPDQMLLDTRPLNMLLERYGPRVVTSTGSLGVSASKPDIWTPEKATGGGGGLWTPGSGSASPASGGDKPKLIIP